LRRVRRNVPRSAIARVRPISTRCLMTIAQQTAREAVEFTLAQIEARNGSTAAVCTINEAALATADALDAERADGSARGPLHGVPILVKDNVDTADVLTTAGSLALAEVPPPPTDAPLVRRLRDAGMVIVGKTNLSEWANIRDGSSTSGWSAF